jgi:hypothetical protein
MDMTRITNAMTAACLALSMFAIVSSPARAEILVLESNVPDLPVGAKFADGKVILIPDDKTLRVLIVTSGSTKTLKGRYQGTVGGYTERRNWWERLVGKGKDGDAPVGAVRGMRAPEN